VTIIEMLDRLVENSIGIHRTSLLDRMDAVGIRSHVKTRCREIRENGVLVEDENGRESFIPADTVVLAIGMKAKTAEASALRAAAGDIPVFEIGQEFRR
jgi:NADH dehydrogenase FAD-containing subunit